jgi:hypothetical protein
VGETLTERVPAIRLANVEAPGTSATVPRSSGASHQNSLPLGRATKPPPQIEIRREVAKRVITLRGVPPALLGRPICNNSPATKSTQWGCETKSLPNYNYKLNSRPRSATPTFLCAHSSFLMPHSSFRIPYARGQFAMRSLPSFGCLGRRIPPRRRLWRLTRVSHHVQHWRLAPATDAHRLPACARVSIGGRHGHTPENLLVSPMWQVLAATAAVRQGPRHSHPPNPRDREAGVDMPVPNLHASSHCPVTCFSVSSRLQITKTASIPCHNSIRCPDRSRIRSSQHWGLSLTVSLTLSESFTPRTVWHVG